MKALDPSLAKGPRTPLLSSTLCCNIWRGSPPGWRTNRPTRQVPRPIPALLTRAVALCPLYRSRTATILTCSCCRFWSSSVRCSACRGSWLQRCRPSRTCAVCSASRTSKFPAINRTLSASGMRPPATELIDSRSLYIHLYSPEAAA